MKVKDMTVGQQCDWRRRLNEINQEDAQFDIFNFNFYERMKHKHKETVPLQVRWVIERVHELDTVGLSDEVY